MITHVTGFLEKWAARFMGSVDITRFVVYGDPSAAAREDSGRLERDLHGPLGASLVSPRSGD